MSRNKITICPMEACHVPQIAELEKVCFSDPWVEAAIASELENPLSFWLVALDGDRVAGYVGSQSVLGEADMMNIAVAPGYRRQGIAKLLLQTLQQGLTEQNVYCLTLEVRRSNEPAITLYGQEGFVQVGCRRNYYRHPTEDALILRKTFDESLCRKPCNGELSDG